MDEEEPVVPLTTVAVFMRLAIIECEHGVQIPIVLLLVVVGEMSFVIALEVDL